MIPTNQESYDVMELPNSLHGGEPRFGTPTLQIVSKNEKSNKKKKVIPLAVQKIKQPNQLNMAYINFLLYPIPLPVKFSIELFCRSISCSWLL